MRPRHGRRLRHGCSAQADVEGGPRPIKVGLSTARTGAIAVNGKQFLAALEIWRDDVNGPRGLLGRPVELVCYDDQSNPANVPNNGIVNHMNFMPVPGFAFPGLEALIKRYQAKASTASIAPLGDNPSTGGVRCAISCNRGRATSQLLSSVSIEEASMPSPPSSSVAAGKM
jgi:hypothetical protein